ncbi:MAG: hypothetical protein V2A79_16560 [Planctomycetota bacterium]
MMHRILVPALGAVLALAGGVVSVPAASPDAQPQPATKPQGDPQTPPPAATTQPEAPPPGGAAVPSQPTQPDDAAARTPPTVSADEVLRAFQRDRPTRVPIAPSGGPDESTSPEASLAPATSRRLPDGYFLVDRVGRVVKEGEWYVFVYEGDNASHPEPPLKLLPNQLLERVVLESQNARNSAVFVVSGEVTEFQNENYLLLRKLLRRRNLGNLEK